MAIENEMTKEELDKMTGGGQGKQRGRQAKQPDWVRTLLWQIEIHGLPKPSHWGDNELRFARSIGRQWRADIAWESLGVLVEYEGGIWMTTKDGRSKGHAHPVRFGQDCEKYNHASWLGYKLYRFTSNMIESGAAIDFLVKVFETKGE